MRLFHVLPIVPFALLSCSTAFVIPWSTTPVALKQQKPHDQSCSLSHRAWKTKTSTTRTIPITTKGTVKSTSTTLYLDDALMDLPDGFFTFSFPILTIMLQISKQINRARLEERAFDLRLKEERRRKLKQDPSLTESELIRQEAARDISYYGPEAMQRRRQQKQEEEEREGGGTSRRKNVVTVIERESSNGNDGGRRYTLSDEEIDELEAMGVTYDPYYDDPYTEEELPDDQPYRQDRRYGDRIYNDGEVFYKDAETGLYFRQGAKPRMSTFWAGGRF